MNLDRNVSEDGRAKYAIVRLRGIVRGSEAYQHLERLHELGHLDWGHVGAPDEFFVMKLRDKYAGEGLRGYAEAVLKDAHEQTDLWSQKTWNSMVMR